MTEFRHDPNSLADRLDQLLPPGKPDQIGADGDPLIETAARIAAAPHPTLSPEAIARIQAQITQVQPAVPQRFPVRIVSSGRLALVAAFTVILIVGTVFAARQLGITLIAATQTPTATSTLTETPSQPPSVTPSSTPTVTRQPTVTATNTALPSATLAPSRTPTPTVIATEDTSVLPTFTASPTTQPGMVVVEGPVEVINGNIVVIYDIEIEVDPNDPILAVIQVGDLVRIEGTVGVEGSTIVVVAVNVVVVNVDVSVSPEGEVWRDTGDCSNPPPPWAPAFGWRARCEGAPRPGNPGGMGMGNPDDDDD